MFQNGFDFELKMIEWYVGVKNEKFCNSNFYIRDSGKKN